MYVKSEKPTRFITKNEIDIQNNKKLRIIIKMAALVLALAMAFAGNLIVPIKQFYDVSGIGQLVFAVVLIIAEMVVYFIAHEYIHSLVSKKITGKSGDIVMDKTFSYSIVKGYYSKNSYLSVCFAPIVIIGAVLLVLMLLLPTRFFWYTYLIQILNIAGATGDFYVAYKLYKDKRELVVEDNGLTVIYWTI